MATRKRKTAHKAHKKSHHKTPARSARTGRFVKR